MSKLILIRHGESEANVKNIFYGSIDSPLTEKGREQARKAKEILKGYNYQKVYSSDLVRASETAKIMNHLGVEIEEVVELREMNFGIFEGLSYEEILKRYPEEEVQWRENWKGYNYETGESVEDLQGRVVGFLEKLNKEDEDIVIFAHWGVINTILSYYVTGGLDGYWKFSTNNCGISILSFTDNYSVLEGLNIRGN